MAISVGELASSFDCELVGDAATLVDNVASLANANERSLSFLSSTAYKPQLSNSRAAAVILRAADADAFDGVCLIAEEPYACYARMAAVVVPPPDYPAGVHPTAQIAAGASVAASAHIAAHVVVDAGAAVGKRCYVGPGSYLGPACRLGDDGRLIANVTLVRQVSIGKRAILHPGVVIGSDGFGNAMTPDGWLKVPQLGGVQIGNDVEIGANSTVDCGALDDTVIEDGVRIDNLVMIAHNVRIGAHTAMAAMTGIAGSAVIGKRCLFAGQSGSVGHVTICDDVVVSGQGMVTKDITEPGVYASSFPAEPVRDWNRKVARFRRIDALVGRISDLEKGNS
ncbi:MAG: UDP-3-O-(3-hydroxymyristoyl)glucosamine N-acyltransferase [Gammaproteobacteria bacterium]|nr:UDP-3-O-(3-hydroxymyristoyl)glucosamine N-acyltransferase [Gammaproteobacteria bacterium]